ncbi:uncharacterized protein MELLADRAFT_106852 [Melampsora larici-populina 98AG31]|uniref:Uncharacterized protein n=1 Tax=Melampsora larici-populina (strain 98AG31 / pathotype 3-4-7) TaxID=747676 RepID=F4RMU8_MELLP|nr:uncharacterized protein MELLADRAFT_106852 [Melampsora larici-populina 98AG31]EGG06318.1 hypothetical protein MELLADRAFT_106852 [Melampsora larici-populina 98AG31]
MPCVITQGKDNWTLILKARYNSLLSASPGLGYLDLILVQTVGDQPMTNGTASGPSHVQDRAFQVMFSAWQKLPSADIQAQTEKSKSKPNKLLDACNMVKTGISRPLMAVDVDDEAFYKGLDP